MNRDKKDLFFMQQALAQARKAAAHDEVPVGALVTNEQEDIIARAYNQTNKRHSPLAHAEIIAITRAAKKCGDWRLTGHTLYVTLEPCALCMQAIIASRISRVVYAAASPLFGFSLDKYCSFDLYKMPLVLTSGIEEQTAQTYLQEFFKKKRENTREQATSRIIGSCKGQKGTSRSQKKS